MKERFIPTPLEKEMRQDTGLPYEIIRWLGVSAYEEWVDGDEPDYEEARAVLEALSYDVDNLIDGFYKARRFLDLLDQSLDDMEEER